VVDVLWLVHCGWCVVVDVLSWCIVDGVLRLVCCG